MSLSIRISETLFNTVTLLQCNNHLSRCATLKKKKRHPRSLQLQIVNVVHVWLLKHFRDAYNQKWHDATYCTKPPEKLTMQSDNLICDFKNLWAMLTLQSDGWLQFIIIIRLKPFRDEVQNYYTIYYYLIINLLYI